MVPRVSEPREPHSRILTGLRDRSPPAGTRTGPVDIRIPNPAGHRHPGGKSPKGMPMSFDIASYSINARRVADDDVDYTAFERNPLPEPARWRPIWSARTSSLCT
jgi:hypothetical protein